MQRESDDMISRFKKAGPERARERKINGTTFRKKGFTWASGKKKKRAVASGEDAHTKARNS